MHRPVRLALLVAVPIAVLLGLDTTAWWLATSRMLREVSAWQQDRIAAGYYVAAGAPARAGWPLRAELGVPNPGLATAAPGTADAAAWTAGEMRLVYVPWRPAEVTVVLGGQQTLQFGTAPPIALSVGRLDLLVPLDEDGQAGGFVANARHLQIPLPAGLVGIDALRLKLAAKEAHVSLSALTLPGSRQPLNETIDSLDVTAHSTVLLPTQRDPATEAAAWRDKGGQLVISDLQLGWGTLSIQGTAQFGLDPALQPMGNGTVHITGYAAAIDSLGRAGLLTQNAARVATTLLGLMSRPGTDGTPQADLPFTVRDGLVSMGAIPVARLPRLLLP